ncbi:hypothetical protein DFH07DRAFT_765597 [Mycena maculata]|uniref:F-box domain-containing protein n=1 Tax=Mycena maculata TaxID=230809 RepID=A0AAD7NYL1_9AGAR|nr:hypothetical protein DFH07DRAFT_765597 [Mycena maculata]
MRGERVTISFHSPYWLPLVGQPKITDEEQLRLLEAKCTQDVEFARMIKKLDLMDVDSSDILLPLFSHLKSLRWLGLQAALVDRKLYTAVNSHPTLATVAVCDTDLRCLHNLFSSTPLPMSKILVISAELHCDFTLQSPALHSLMSRSPRVAHLSLGGLFNIRNGPGTLLFPGLEELDIGVFYGCTTPMSWLPAFVDRHPSLETIKFIGGSGGLSWTRNPDVLFPLQFIDALERESLSRTAGLKSFSVSRTASATSLDEWQIADLDIEILKSAGISALRIATLLAPKISSLAIRMTRFNKQPFRIDDLVSPLCLFPSLRRLELHRTYKHLAFQGQAPWALPPSDSDPPSKTSNCVVAHAALRWVTAEIARCALSIDLIHITDEGREGRALRYYWELAATYWVGPNRELEAVGTPQLDMDEEYFVPHS